MTNPITLCSIAILLLFFSCKKKELQIEGDFFYLNNVGAKMPVWVKGNKESEKFIILLHGGPEGGSSQYYSIFPSHQKIEKEFAIVYWDQRMCGMSQGNPSMANATLDQFTDDLDKLITLINYKYGNPKIFLMGHSWGGALGTNYLIDHQSRVTGWIEIDGGHSWTKANALSRDSMLIYAQNKINRNEEKDFWQFSLNWYKEHSVVKINDNAHYTYVAHANGYDYNPKSDSLKIPFSELLLYSPISTAYFFVPYQFSFLDKGLALEHQLNKITLPTLICWGRHDKVFPVQIANETYTNLATPTTHKYIHVFENSAHSPNYEEPTLFAHKVIAFVQKY